MKYKNTLKKGSVRHIIFKEGDTWYGVALEFNIVEEGDDPVEVMASLFNAIQGYVQTARTLKLRPMPLNQVPEKEYQELWDRLEGLKRTTKADKTVPVRQVFNFGYSPFAAPAFAA